MTLVTFCIPCQHGFHDQHREITQQVPEGVMGGAMCPCKGDCAERNAHHTEVVARVVDDDYGAVVEQLAALTDTTAFRESEPRPTQNPAT